MQRRRTVFAFVALVALSLALASASAQGNGGGNGGNGGGSNGGGGNGGSSGGGGPPEATPSSGAGNGNGGSASQPPPPAEPQPQPDPEPQTPTQSGGGPSAPASHANEHANAGGPPVTGPPAGTGNADEHRPDLNETRGKGRPDANETRGKGRPDANETRGKGKGRPDENETRGASGETPAALSDEPPGLERSSLPEEAREDPPRVSVRRGEDRIDVARGDVAVAAENTDAPSTIIVIVHPNGTEEVLAEGETLGTWNTTRYENGYYTVEVRERSSNGQMVTVASTSILVENPRASALAAVASVATGAVVSAGAGVAAARGVDLLAMLKQGATEAAGTVAEDALRARTAKARRWRQRSWAVGAILVGVAAALLAFFKTYTLQSTLSQVLVALPIAGTAVLVASLGEYAAEWSLARASGARTRFRLWAPGTISLVASSVLFRSSFGYPGYVDEDEPGDDTAPRQRRLAGLRALALLGVGVALSVPFVLIGRVWRWDFAEFGIGVALMMSAAASIPVRPMPGRDVWDWSRPAAVVACVALSTVYVLWQLAVVPLALLAALGVLGIAGFVYALVRLRHAA